MTSSRRVHVSEQSRYVGGAFDVCLSNATTSRDRFFCLGPAYIQSCVDNLPGSSGERYSFRPCVFIKLNGLVLTFS